MTNLGSDHPFTESRSSEPHFIRRREILKQHPELPTLAGYDVRTAYVTLGVLAAQLGVAAALATLTARLPSGERALWVLATALVLGAILSHWLAMSIHEASHNLALRTPAQNIALGLLANVPLVVPAAMTFRRYHLEHHRQLGVLGRDTDLPHPLEVRWVRNRGPLKLLWWVFYAAIYVVRGLTFVKPPNRLELLNLALMVPVNAALWLWLGPSAVAYLALSLFFAHGLHPVAAHFIHEHYVFAEGQETYSYYGPLNWVTFNVGYHNEHHDFPNVPGWRLPALRARARPHYERLVSHGSWTCVLWRFITDPSLGFASRVVRRGRLASGG